MASGSHDKTIKIWCVCCGTLVRTLTGHTYVVRSLAKISENLLASGSYREIKIWDFNDGTLVRTLTGHTDIVMSLAKLSENLMASGSDDNTIKIWK